MNLIDIGGFGIDCKHHMNKIKWCKSVCFYIDVKIYTLFI